MSNYVDFSINMRKRGSKTLNLVDHEGKVRVMLMRLPIVAWITDSQLDSTNMLLMLRD